MTHRLREWLEGSAQGRSTDRIQLAADEKRTVFPDGELEAAFLDGNALVMGYAFRVQRMT